MYEDIKSMVEDAEIHLRTHFVVSDSDEIHFNEANVNHYLAALDTNHEVMVALFQKVAGLPDREFERQYGVSGIGSRLRGRKTTFTGYEDAERFAEALTELMPATLSMEAVLYTFYKSWEANQRRFYRMRYEDEILDFLNDNQYQAWKGNSLPGEPDIVIPETEPYEVVGEVRVIQQKDKEKRFKEFRSEASEAKASFGEDTYFIAVANLGKQYLEERDRETVRSEITKNDTSEIDAVFFHDERDKMLKQLEAWDVSQDPQQRLGDN
jgi:hypothetical protein